MGAPHGASECGGMSALTPKADIDRGGWHVRFVPLATNAPQQTASLFDHLVGQREELRRHLEAEHLRGLKVDHKLEFRRQQDR